MVFMVYLYGISLHYDHNNYMNALTLDTLSIAKRLKSQGFNDTQAEAIAFEMKETAQEDHLVTKHYLDEKLEKVELHMTIRLGVMLAAAVGVILTAAKLMFG